jgi:DNA mismatch endonuclease (patch repair protein)
VAVADKAVLASIYFRRVAGRRVYAYLRWADNGQTSEKFVCEIDRPSRMENLTLAWAKANEDRMLVPVPGQLTTSASRSWASSETVRRQMQANKGRDTKPELALRSRIHRTGLRYKVGIRPLPGIRRTADMVFTRARVAVFMDGCYWHGCPDHYRPARRNEKFWREKIDGNRARDAETDRLLRDAGWTVVRVWEHEELEAAAERVRTAVLSKQSKHPARAVGSFGEEPDATAVVS